MRREPVKSVLASTLMLLGCFGVTSAASAIEAGSGPPPEGRVLRIVATDDGFEAPVRVPPGIRHISLVNRGREIHEAMLVKLPPGMSAADYVAAVKGGALFPAGALDYSGPGLTSPGETVELWVRLDPGRYVVICWNADHVRTRKPHSFVVEDGPTVDDAPPPEDAVVKLMDYRFELSRPLQAGARVLRFETVGPSMHEADIFRLSPGKTIQDLLRWRARDGAGETPALALGGILDSHDISRPVWLRRTFAPGRYVLHCEMPMSEEAKAGSHFLTHADAGMFLPFEISE